MTTVQLAKVLNGLGTNSVRDLFRRTGSSDPSVFRQAQIAAIDSFYLKSGGFKGPLGFPLEQVQFTGLTATRRYAGGQVTYLTNDPQGERKTAVAINYLGLRCIKESKHDQSTGSDEPYFLISVVASNGKKVVRRAYEDINTKSVRTEFTKIVTAGVQGGEDNLTPPLVLSVIAIEHDHGSKDEAERKVREVLKKVEEAIDAAAQQGGTVTGVPVGNHVAPEWMRKLIFGWGVEGIAALFGLGDDAIGQNGIPLFEFKADLLEWRAPAAIGKHGNNEYNLVLPIDGGNQGIYELFFSVDLFQVSAIIEPRA